MVRRCARSIVGQCNETDQTLLAHRVPKQIELARKWQVALELEQYSISELQKRFVVCARHFEPRAYRNERSNGLNTNAIPNLNENLDNERIYYSNKKEQSEVSATVSKSDLTLLVKDPTERDYEIITNPAKKFKSVILEINHVVIDEQDIEEPETFEVHEYSPDDQKVQAEAGPLQSPTRHTKHVASQTDPEPGAVAQTLIEPMLNAAFDATTMTTEPFLFFSNSESQTDPEPENIPQATTESTQCSKDDKLFSILYPEFKGRNKIELVEMINEKNHRIESLEDKVKKLELAMRNLL